MQTITFSPAQEPVLRPSQDRPSRTLDLMRQGLKAFDAGDLPGALALMRKALAQDLRQTEPWFWMGRIQEDMGDRAAAGYCYYLSCTGKFLGPSKQALSRLGYLGVDE